MQNPAPRLRPLPRVERMTGETETSPSKTSSDFRKNGGLIAKILQLPGQSVYSKALTLFVAFSLLLGMAVVLLTSEIILREFNETERQLRRLKVNQLCAVYTSVALEGFTYIFL